MDRFTSFYVHLAVFAVEDLCKPLCFTPCCLRILILSDAYLGLLLPVPYKWWLLDYSFLWTAQLFFPKLQLYT